MLKNTFIYLASSVISKGVPFALLPFTTSYLTKEEFGMLSIFLVVNTIYTALIGMSLNTNITKNFHIRKKKTLSVIIGNIFILLLIVCCIFSFINILINSQTDDFFSIPTSYILYIPVLALISTSVQIFLTILRNENKAYLFGASEVSNASINIVTTLIFLVFLGQTWLSQIIGIVISNSIISILGLIYIKRNNYVTFIKNKRVLKSILSISIPLIPHVIGNTVIALSDRLFLERMINLETVAVYSIGYSFGSIVLLVTDAFIKAWSPWFYKTLSKPTINNKLKIVKSTYIYIITITLIGILISIVSSQLLTYVVAPGYEEAEIYIYIISLAYVIQGIYKIFFPYLVHISKTEFLAFSTLTAAAINLILNYYFIKLYGGIGAAYATVISLAVSATLVCWYQQKNYWMPWLFLKLKLENKK